MKAKELASTVLRGTMFLSANIALVFGIMYFAGVNGFVVIAAMILGSKLSSTYESLRFKIYADITLALTVGILLAFSDKWIPQSALSLVNKSLQSYVPSAEILHAMLSTTTSVIVLSTLVFFLSVLLSNTLLQQATSFKKVVIDERITDKKIKGEMV